MSFSVISGQILQPTMGNLSALLKNRDSWPNNFKWNYSNTRTCALGLMEYVWPHFNGKTIKERAEILGIEEGLAESIFLKAHTVGHTFWERIVMKYRGSHEVTPEHIALMIDRHLSK